MKELVCLTLAAILLAAGSASAAGDVAATPSADRPSASGSAASAPTEMTEGEVRKVDMDNKKITLRHGEIRNLGMPAMSMVFQVSDPAFLDRVKTGDKVRFTAERTNGALTVTRIEPAN